MVLCWEVQCIWNPFHSVFSNDDVVGERGTPPLLPTAIVCFLADGGSVENWQDESPRSCLDGGYFGPAPPASPFDPLSGGKKYAKIVNDMIKSFEASVVEHCRRAWEQNPTVPPYFLSLCSSVGGKEGDVAGSFSCESIFREGGGRQWRLQADRVVNSLPHRLKEVLAGWRRHRNDNGPTTPTSSLSPVVGFVLGCNEYARWKRGCLSQDRRRASGPRLAPLCRYVPDALFKIVHQESCRLQNRTNQECFWFGRRRSSRGGGAKGNAAAAKDRLSNFFSSSTKEGCLSLNELQKEAVMFFFRRGGRAMNASEMGTGKTATAVVCASFAVQHSPFLKLSSTKEEESARFKRILAMWNPAGGTIGSLPDSRKMPVADESIQTLASFPRGTFWKKTIHCRTVLVVCPASVKESWKREFARFAPEFRATVLGSTAEATSEATKMEVLRSACEPGHRKAFQAALARVAEREAVAEAEGAGGIKRGAKKRKRGPDSASVGATCPSGAPPTLSACAIITSFASLSSKNKEIQKLAANALMIIFDESHCIKNVGSQRSRAALQMAKTCPHVYLLSGTPGCKSMDMVTQLRAVSFDPSPLVQVLPYHTRQAFTEFSFGTRYCLPQSVHKAHRGGKSHGRLNSRDVKMATSCRQGELHVLGKLFCNRVRKEQALPDLPSKTRVKTVIHTLAGSDKLYFENKLDKIAEVREEVNEKRAGIMLMELVRETAQLKAELLKDHIQNRVLKSVSCGKDKILFFAHHSVMLEAICQQLNEGGRTFMTITGKTPAKKRQALVDSFQNDQVQHAVLSIQAAGTGLNLFSATRVIICELIWSEHHLMQAEDRAHRRGLNHDVVVDYLVVQNSTDDLVWRSISKKSSTANWMLDNCKKSSLGNLLQGRKK